MNGDVIELGQGRAQLALDVFGQQVRLDQRRVTGRVTVQGQVDASGRVTVPQDDVMARARAAHPIGDRHDLIAQPVGLRADQPLGEIAG